MYGHVGTKKFTYKQNGSGGGCHQTNFFKQQGMKGPPPPTGLGRGIFQKGGGESLLWELLLYHGWGLPELAWVLTWILWRGPPQGQQGMPGPPSPTGLGREFLEGEEGNSFLVGKAHSLLPVESIITLLIVLSLLLVFCPSPLRQNWLKPSLRGSEI